MVTRKILLATNEFYHIFNRTVGSEVIFNNKNNLKRILALCNFYRFKSSISFSYFQKQSEEKRKDLWAIVSSGTPLVEVYCFVFMPNHYHFLLKQLYDGGIEIFIGNIQNSFAKFYNTKFNRQGSLFCHSFDRILIESEGQFIHLSRYIHLNPVTNYLIKLEEIDNYPYSSFSMYVKKRNFEFVKTDIVINYFKNYSNYKKFVYNQSDYQKRLKKIKNLLLEKQRNFYKGSKLTNPKG